MTSPSETAMAPPAPQTDPADPADPAAPNRAEGAAPAAAARSGPRRERSAGSVLGVLAAALVSAMLGVLMWQIDSLSARMDRLDAKLDTQIDRLDAKIDDVETSLRAEMRAGFAQINEVLLDHTDRLARLEAAAGLPRPGD